MAKFVLQVVGLLALSVCVFASPIPRNSGMFGKYFQGDIKLTEAQQQMINGIAPNTGLLDSFWRWHRNIDGDVVVPYNFNSTAGFTESEIAIMVADFRVLESQTCIRFVERTTEIHYVDVISDGGCWSWLGRLGGRQEMSMSRPDGCVIPGMMAHEAIHALGYDHMHMSAERNDYVEVLWDNIIPEFRFAFEIVNPNFFNNFGTTYDLISVMHYPRWAFTQNGQDTIRSHDPAYLDVIGSMDVSPGDFLRLNRMYQC